MLAFTQDFPVQFVLRGLKSLSSPYLLYMFPHPCLCLINYKVSINKREQLFKCSAISLAKAIFILQPFIYHHSTLVRLAIALQEEGDSN